MGSFVSQFSTVAEIRRDEVGPYAHFLVKMYGKIGLKIENFHINGQKSENLPVHLLWNLVDMFILWSYKKYMRELWKFWFFGRLHRTECWKIMKNQKFEHSVRCNRPKNQNFHNSRIYFLQDHGMNISTRFYCKWTSIFSDFCPLWKFSIFRPIFTYIFPKKCA